MRSIASGVLGVGMFLFASAGAAGGGASHYLFVDLTPSGYTDGFANRAAGGRQVGHGRHAATHDIHALLWSGSASSFVDLNPAGFFQSFAYGIDGAAQYGSGNGPATGGRTHALMWAGSAGSFVDLQPGRLPQLGHPRRGRRTACRGGQQWLEPRRPLARHGGKRRRNAPNDRRVQPQLRNRHGRHAAGRRRVLRPAARDPLARAR
jgi:hypothetical protein